MAMLEAHDITRRGIKRKRSIVQMELLPAANMIPYQRAQRWRQVLFCGFEARLSNLS